MKKYGRAVTMVMLVNKVVINVPRFHIECLLFFFVRFETHLKFYDWFNETGQSDQWILSCFMRPNGQTDRLYEANGSFSHICEQANQRIEFSAINIATVNIMKTQRILLHGQNNFVNLVGESIGQLVYWWGLRLSLFWVYFDVVFSISRQIS